MDIVGMRHVIDGSAVRHLLKQHGSDAGEAKRGQVATAERDIETGVDVISDPDTVAFGATNKRGDQMIAHMKRMHDGAILHIEEVRTGRRELAMRKHPAAKDFGSVARTLLSNARSDGGAAINVVTRPASVKESRFVDAARAKVERMDIGAKGEGERGIIARVITDAMGGNLNPSPSCPAGHREDCKGELSLRGRRCKPRGE